MGGVGGPGDRLLAAGGVLFVLLFGAGLVFADQVARPAFPGLGQPPEVALRYFTENRGAVRALSVFHAFAAMAIVLFTAHVGARLRGAPAGAGDHGGMGTLAAIGGGIAGAFLLLDACLFWVLADPSTTTDPALARALHALSYLCGGVALMLPMAAFIGATSLVAFRTGLLPRWLSWAGMAAAGEGLVYATTLTGSEGPWSPSGVLVVGAALPVLWLGAASFVLTRRARV